MRKGRRVLGTVRTDELDAVVLCGNVQLTTQALRRLLGKGIETAFLTRGGAFLGRLSAQTGKNAELRRTQYARLEEEETRLDLACRFVRGKLKNQRALLLRYQRKRKSEKIARSLVSIRRMVGRLDEVSAMDSIRGVEGKAAADYFGVFGELLSAPGISFEGRKRRPPPDPTNILLSFGYTLLGNLIQGYVELAGLDPYLGALHEVSYGRPSLALDLLEEWRPVVVDAAVLRALNTGALAKRHFLPVDEDDAPVEEEWEREELAEHGDAGGARRKLILTPEGSKRWFTAYERRLGERTYYEQQGRQLSYRQAIREQVYLLARHLRDEEPYGPYVSRG